MIVYKATNKINGHSYIGRSKRFSGRKADHLRLSKNRNIKYPFYHALRKYGSENFEWCILEECKTECELIKKEQFYIDKLGYYNIGNAKDGGDNITNNPRKNEIDWNSEARSKALKEYCKTKEGKKQRAESGKKTMTPEKNKEMLLRLKQKMTNVNFKKENMKKQRLPGGAYSPEIIEKRANNKARKWIIWKEGKIEIIKNLNKFCKERNLSVGAMHSVSTGKRNHHKGFKVRRFSSLVAE